MEGQRGGSHRKLELNVRFLGLRKELLKTPRKRGVSIKVKVEGPVPLAIFPSPQQCPMTERGSLNVS